MKSDVVQFVFVLLVLVFGGACEELFPKFLGVGFPFLLMATIFLAPRRTALSAVLFAVAAGSFEDALSGLPFATSVCFFTVAAVVVRSARLSYAAMAVAHPLYQAWLWLWRPGADGGVFGRILASVPTGPAAAALTAAVLFWLERRAAIGER